VKVTTTQLELMKLIFSPSLINGINHCNFDVPFSLQNLEMLS
jgi:hypothetical protein